MKIILILEQFTGSLWTLKNIPYISAFPYRKQWKFAIQNGIIKYKQIELEFFDQYMSNKITAWM